MNPEGSSPILKGRQAQLFEALQGCLVPLSRQFTPEQREQSRELVNRALRSQPPAQLEKFRLFLNLINVTAIGTTGKSFAKLSVNRQRRLLQNFFDSPIALLRKGFWGLNTLAKMGVYGQESVHNVIHYRLRKLPK